MKKLLSLLAATLLALAACDDNDGQQACEAYGQKCPAGSTGAVSCNADNVNNAANGAQVEDCIQSAADCAAATECYKTLK